MKLDDALLGMLAMRRMSGYDLKRWLEVEGRFLGFDPHPSQIYRVLNRLHAEGLIEFDVTSRSGPDAKVYRLLPAGAQVFREWIASPHEPAFAPRSRQFMGRLMFTVMMDVERAIELLKQEVSHREALVLKYRDRDRRPIFVDPIPEIDQQRAKLIIEELHSHGAKLTDEWILWLKNLVVVLESERQLEHGTQEEEVTIR